MEPTRPPSVDSLARSLADSGLPHPLLVQVARLAIELGQYSPDEAERLVEQRRRQLLQPVINATGVLLHTNLGRAPTGVSLVPRFANLELDLSTGQRGSRQAHVGALFAELCGAEAAIVVNNCAAAVTLALAALAEGRGVAVSRSELVEIGGGFRVPEVMEQSGAQLVGVGTTNRTRVADFEKAVANADADIAVALQVHQSNYKIVGFTEQVRTAELADLDVPVIADIGSGLLDAACPWLPGGPPAWLADEPAARQTLEAGADLITFSGDKLLGGPQAGIIAGSAELVERCSRHPLARAVRPGGLVLAALQDVALAYLDRNLAALPFWSMATRSLAELQAAAEALATAIDHPSARVSETIAVPGGGTLPTVEIGSWGIAIDGDITEPLRSATPPIIGRVTDQTTFLDMRTIDPASSGDAWPDSAVLTHVAAAAKGAISR